MAGELVPLVLLPRYTTYAGYGDYSTIGMDVTPYEKMIVNVWRRGMLGATPTFEIKFQESTDQDNWQDITVSPATSDPGVETEVQYTGSLTRRWFRAKIHLGGTNPVVTCWAAGFLEERQT